MRTKTEERRDAILTVASAAFREQGFDATSMSQIAARVGGSKATLYNYFPSKEELLLAAMVDGAEKFAHEVLSLFNTEGTLAEQLRRFVTSFLRVLHAPDIVGILRVAISVGGTTDVGRRFFELGTHDVWSTIATFLAKEIQSGSLRDDDPKMMAMHLQCLCEAGLIQRLMGALETLSDDEIVHRANCTVDVFLRAYGATEKNKAA